MMDNPNIANQQTMTPTAIRQTRGALSDLSRQMTATLLTSPSNQISSSLNTPASSPEEMLIKLRGQRNPVTWSPFSIKEVRKLSHYEITPPKDLTPTRAMIGLRISPRKRLQLAESVETGVVPPPEKMRKFSNQVVIKKTQKLEKVGCNVPLDTALKSLSHSQLIDIILQMTHLNKDVKMMVESTIPEPDLQPILEELSILRKNICKSLPSSRLWSKTDSTSYNKASIHLLSFKKCLVDNCKKLLESKQWASVIDYTLGAWSHVEATPVWENSQHNAIRKHCFKTLSSSCLKALKNYENKDLSWKLQVKERLERLKDNKEDLEVCLSYLDSLSSTDI